MLSLYIASHTILYNKETKPGTLQPTPDSGSEENRHFSHIYVPKTHHTSKKYSENTNIYPNSTYFFFLFRLPAP